MPPSAGQMWLDVARRRRPVPERRRGKIRRLRKGEIRRPPQPPRSSRRTGGRCSHLVKSIVKPRPGGNVGEIGDARSGLSNTGSGSSKG
uniref:Uncharacterized protein n=1 Tax=Oryza glumipatula TaxID=40148 RepID=A0A0D9ZIJ2_9ORYZ